MLLSFGIYCNKEKFKDLQIKCLSLLINSLKDEHLITFSFSYPDKYRGEHLRVWMGIGKKADVVPVKEKVKETIYYFIKDSLSDEPPSVRLNKLFLDYQINSLIFFASKNNPFSIKIDTLGVDVIDEIHEISLLIKSGFTHYKDCNKLLLGIRFYFILNMIWSEQNYDSLRKITKKTLLLFSSSKNSHPQVLSIKKNTEQVFQDVISPLREELGGLSEAFFSKNKLEDIDNRWSNLILVCRKKFNHTTNNRKGRSFSYFLHLLEFTKFQLEIDYKLHLQILILLNKTLDKRHNKKILN